MDSKARAGDVEHLHTDLASVGFMKNGFELHVYPPLAPKYPIPQLRH
jgi:hypothetical protein